MILDRFVAALGCTWTNFVQRGPNFAKLFMDVSDLEMIYCKLGIVFAVI